MSGYATPYYLDVCSRIRQANYGARYQGYIMVADGTAPEASDNDQVVATFYPTADTLQTATILAQPDVPRTLLVTITDANSSMTAVRVVIYGEDQFGNKVQSIIRSKGGTKTIATGFAYRSVSKVLSYVSGTVTGGNADSIKVGTTNVLGLPVAIASTDDLIRLVVGGTADDLATATIDVQNSTWLPAQANLPNGTKTFLVEALSTLKYAAFPKRYEAIIG